MSIPHSLFTRSQLLTIPALLPINVKVVLLGTKAGTQMDDLISQAAGKPAIRAAAATSTAV